MDKTQSKRLHEWHAKSIIYSKVAGIAHRRLMAFYQGSLEVCSPLPPAAQLPLTQGRFSSRAHFFFPNGTCFQSKMSDISETNNPRFCSFIFTQKPPLRTSSCLQLRAFLCCGSKLTYLTHLFFCVLTIELLNVTRLQEFFFFF